MKSNELNIEAIVIGEEDWVKCFQGDISFPINQYLRILCAYLKQKQKYHISRKEICEKAHLSYNNVYRIDTCQVMPQVDTLFKLLDAVDCSLTIDIVDLKGNDNLTQNMSQD